MSIKIGIGRMQIFSGGGGGGGTPPDPALAILSDGNTVAWYDSTDLTTITKGGTDLVSRWNDKLLSGHDLIQATAANQPKWVLNDGLLFDGTNDFMKSATFPYIQPEQIYLVFAQLGYTYAEKVLDGFNSAYGAVRTEWNAPYTLQLYAGAYGSLNNHYTINNFYIVRMLFNGAASKLWIGTDAGTVADVGTRNMDGITIGANAGGGEATNIKVKEAIYRKVVDSAGDEAAIYAYLKSKHGL